MASLYVGIRFGTLIDVVASAPPDRRQRGGLVALGNAALWMCLRRPPQPHMDVAKTAIERS